VVILGGFMWETLDGLNDLVRKNGGYLKIGYKVLVL
jgi:hypothetical protein